jgi:DNA polymerase-4
MILHIDMDAFFASVEQLDDPTLKGKALVVGGRSGRGVVAAASYEARHYGIRSAMPIFMAKRRCPDIIVVPPRRRRYKAISKSVMAILHRYSPVVEQVSIDEAYLDATGCRRLHGPPIDMARTIKTDIHRKVHLTCSIGVAPLKFLAKIASDMDKPDGLTVIQPTQQADFIAALPVAKVPGVGNKAQRRLMQLGIDTLGDVLRYQPALLLDRLGRFGHRLIDLANGQDASTITPHSPTKSVSTERTLPSDTIDRQYLRHQLLAQSQEVGRQLRRQGVFARTITLKLKDRDFRQMTRSITLARPSQSSDKIFRTASDLLARQPLSKPVRLIGIGASSLSAATVARQASLFPEVDRLEKDWENVDRTVDRIADRFGSSAVHRGSLKPSEDLSID